MPDIYGSVDGFKTYHTERGRDITGYGDPEIAEKLIVSSEWVDGRYRGYFPGTKVGQRAQIREWPRYSAVDINGYSIASDSIPLEAEYATYEVALKELQTPGTLNTDYVQSEYKRVAVEGAVSVEYADRSANEVQAQFYIVDAILGPILTGGSNMGGYSGLARRG